MPSHHVPKTVIIAYDFAHINGGQAKVAIESALLLAAAGVNVVYFAAVGPVDERLAQQGIRVVLLEQQDILTEPSRIKAAARGIWNIPAQRALSELCAEYDPANTVLHCHGYAKALSPAIGTLLTGNQLPCVYTMHEYFLACPNGGFYDFQKHEICRKKALGMACLSTNCDVRHPAHKAWRVVRQLATRHVGKMPSGLKHVIYISETQRRVMAPYLNKDTRLHHVPNPMSFPDSRKPVQPDGDMFVFVGRMSPEKGATVFAEAAKMLGVKAVFVGDGPEADKVRSIYPEATITGWATPDEVKSWIARARALVFPSLWYETFGLVACEALAQAIPVVCGAWNASSEMVRDGVNGVIYTDPTAQALAKAMVRVQSIPPFDGHEIRELVSPQKHVETLFGIYAEAIHSYMMLS